MQKKKPAKAEPSREKHSTRDKSVGGRRAPKFIGEGGAVGGLTDDDWPEPEDCGGRQFDQEGTASAAVDDCNELPGRLLIRLTKEAKDDAQAKANFRCPTRCPAELKKWRQSKPTCENDVVTVTMTGSFVCVEK